MSNVAVVTGAGSGVGRAVVFSLAARGYRIALIGRRREALDETIALTESREALVAIPCDVGDEKSVRAMARQVREGLGGPYVLVNSAGTNVVKRSLAELSADDYRHIIDVNLN